MPSIRISRSDILEPSIPSLRSKQHSLLSRCRIVRESLEKDYLRKKVLIYVSEMKRSLVCHHHLSFKQCDIAVVAVCRKFSQPRSLAASLPSPKSPCTLMRCRPILKMTNATFGTRTAQRDWTRARPLLTRSHRRFRMVAFCILLTS